MAIFTDRYDDENKKENKEKKKSNSSDRLYRINGSVIAGKTNTAFTKEIRARSKPEALEKAYEDVKKQYRVESYQIVISSVREGGSI